MQDHLEGVNFPSGQVVWKCNWAHKLRFCCMRSYIIHVYCWHGLACIRIVQVKWLCTFSTSIAGLPYCIMSAHYLVQQGRPRYMPTINIALPWCRRATGKRAPFWARGLISRPNQHPSRFTWYSCSLPWRHSLMRKTSIPWQGRWFGVNNYCS